jgi:restriction system protein
VGRRQIETIDITPAEFERQVKTWLARAKRTMARFEVTGLRKLEGPGGEYELDAVAEFEIFGGARILILVECKRYTSRVERDVVMLLHAKVTDTGAHKGIVFATAGFQSGALKYAMAHGIATVSVIDGRTTYETKGAGSPASPPPWIGLPRVAGWMVTLNQDESQVNQLIDDQTLAPIADWLEGK